MTSTDTTLVIDAEPATGAAVPGETNSGGAAAADQPYASPAGTQQPATGSQNPGVPHSSTVPHSPAVQPNAAAPQKPDTAFAITSFVLGVASVISSWTFVAPIIGLVFGILALRRRTTERTLALWGVWLNGVMLALTALVMLGVIAVAGLGFLASIPHWVAG